MSPTPPWRMGRTGREKRLEDEVADPGEGGREDFLQLQQVHLLGAAHARVLTQGLPMGHRVEQDSTRPQGPCRPPRACTRSKPVTTPHWNGVVNPGHLEEKFPVWPLPPLDLALLKGA